MIYRREQGKALDAWVEALDMANAETLDLVDPGPRVMNMRPREEDFNWS